MKRPKNRKVEFIIIKNSAKNKLILTPLYD